MKECEQGIVARDRVHHSCCDEVRALELQGLHRIRELDKTAAEWQAKCESAWAQLEAANLQLGEVTKQLSENAKGYYVGLTAAIEKSAALTLQNGEARKLLDEFTTNSAVCQAIAPLCVGGHQEDPCKCLYCRARHQIFQMDEVSEKREEGA